MRWGAVVPLVGGQLLGSEMAIGTPPAEMASFSAFEYNDGFARRRWPDAPFRLIDRGERMAGRFMAVVSVCPCAGLSMLSTAKSNSDARDRMNQWMFQSAEYVMGDVRPDVYMGENAPNMFSNMGRPTVARLVDIARRNGYTVTFYKTNAVTHGLPQRRIRTFYYFWREQPPPAEVPWFDRAAPSALEYLSSMGRPDGWDAKTTYDLKELSLYRFLRSRYGDAWRNGGEDPPQRYSNGFTILTKKQLLHEYIERSAPDHDHFRKAMLRYRDKMAGDGGGVFIFPPVFDMGGYPAVMKKTAEMLVHPTEDRYLNVREVGWLMGLPGDFEMPPRDRFNVLCQNVPVQSARDATSVALEHLGGRLKRSTDDVMWFDNESKRAYRTIDKLPLTSHQTELSTGDEVFA